MTLVGSTMVNGSGGAYMVKPERGGSWVDEINGYVSLPMYVSDIRIVQPPTVLFAAMGAHAVPTCTTSNVRLPNTCDGQKPQPSQSYMLLRMGNGVTAV